MSHLLQIIKKPLITERATNLKADANQYVFRVSSDAAKGDIKRAIEELFKVSVTRVRTLNVRGKFRRMEIAPAPTGRIGKKRSSLSKQVKRSRSPRKRNEKL